MHQIDPTIYYILATSDWQPNDATPMQGFAPSLARSAWVVNGVARSAASVLDHTPAGREALLARKLAGQAPIQFYPQSPRAIKAIPVPAFMPFALYFLPDEENVEDYKAWADQCPIHPTFVANSGADLTFSDVTMENLKRVFLEKLGRMPKDIDPTSVNELRDAISSWEPTPERKLNFTIAQHGSVDPNISALVTAGFSNFVSGPFRSFDLQWKPYIDQIVQTTNAILDERDALGQRDLQRIWRTTPDINLYAPSIYPHFFDLKPSSDWAPEERRRFRLTMDIFRTQDGYSFTVETEARQQAMMKSNKKGRPTPQPHPLFFLRGQEVRLGNAVMSVLAASEFSAVLRMPNAINRTSGTVRSFAEHYRSHAPKSRKRLLAFREMQSRLNAAFPEELKDLVRRSSSGVRIVSDAHVEWLDIDGLPLMLRKTCSRIPVTPGNLFVSEVGPKEIIHLTPAELRKVLVVSALKPDDPIAGIFENAFETFADRWKGKLEITTTVVSSEDEFVQAINAFDGYLLVFDGHGGHNPGEPGKLFLQDAAIDVWSLGDKLTRIPPIVILSACDTHAADRNHATTANGFISLGARAVLGSVFPIEARHAAIFAARFLFRVAEFLEPAIALFERALRWSDVVTGMLRMQLLTDYLRALRRENLLDDDQYAKIHVAGNMAINGERDDPFAYVLTELEKLGLQKTDLARELEMAVANSNVISYLHVGRPETILIDTVERVTSQLKELDAMDDRAR